MSHLKKTVRRPFQREVLREFVRSNSRFWALLWERQAGKSSTLADFALYEMLRHRNRTVVYASASLLLAQEVTLKTAIRANQSVQQVVEGDAAFLKQFADTAQSRINAQTQKPIAQSSSVTELLNQRYAAHQLKNTGSRLRNVVCLNDVLQRPRGDTSAFVLVPASPSKPQFKTYDSQEDREVKHYTASDFTSLFKQQRLEFRVYHSPTEYSRTKVIAPNIATARSWSGTVLLDEVAFIRNFKELITALLPVISTDKQFKLILSTTPPEFDDTHYSFELLAPPADLKFEPNAAGNWYTSQSGVRVHRADAFDTALAGKKIFDLKTGAEITPAEAFQRAPNKDGHRIAHFLTWMLGGSAACDLARLTTAQERGAGGPGANQCHNFQINNDCEMGVCLDWLAQNLGGEKYKTGGKASGNKIPDPPIYSYPATPDFGSLYANHFAAKARTNTGRCSGLLVGIGFDVATTTKGKSNPSVVSIMEEHGPEWIVRARFIWKTTDPRLANERLTAILNCLERCGARPKALAQDATNERYYAEQNRQLFRKRLPVLLVVASEAVNKQALDKPTNWKEYLGNQLVAKLNDNNLTLPPDEYTRTDYRLVMKDRGRFVCEPNDQGMHGDCFDADKLAGHALTDYNSRRTVVAQMTYTPYPIPLG